MIARTILSMRASTLRWSKESRRFVRSDPGASYCGEFRDRHHKTAVGGIFGSEQALAADYGRDQTLTYSTQATTILTPTASKETTTTTNASRRAFSLTHAKWIATHAATNTGACQVQLRATPTTAANQQA